MNQALFGNNGSELFSRICFLLLLFFQVQDKVNEMLTSVDGQNLKENVVEVYEDPMDGALEELSGYQTGIS